MFGYVTPCNMELKMKDYEKFKAYYCGLCSVIKSEFGNLPRLALNYDMTFIGIMLSSLKNDSTDNIGTSFKMKRCVLHPVKKRLFAKKNEAIAYAAFLNLALMYYKLLDDYMDDRSYLSKFIADILKLYINKTNNNYKTQMEIIKTKLEELYKLESNSENFQLDEIADPFGALIGLLLTSYKRGTPYEESLYKLGYNLGKWIYLIDAYDDLKKDMDKNKFNVINAVFNKGNLPFMEFNKVISNRIEFILVSCGAECYSSLKSLPLKSNQDLLENILQFGLMEKIDKVFKRSELSEKSI
ncbi:MAG TPA: DUF5685 family protein [Clostridiaceae bacterium]